MTALEGTLCGCKIPGFTLFTKHHFELTLLQLPPENKGKGTPLSCLKTKYATSLTLSKGSKICQPVPLNLTNLSSIICLIKKSNNTWFCRKLFAELCLGWEQEAAGFSFLSSLQIWQSSHATLWEIKKSIKMSNNCSEALYLTQCWWCRVAGWSGSVMPPEPQWQSNDTTCHWQTCSRLWHPRHSDEGRTQGPAGRWHDTAASQWPRSCLQGPWTGHKTTFYSFRCHSNPEKKNLIYPE